MRGERGGTEEDGVGGVVGGEAVGAFDEGGVLSDTFFLRVEEEFAGVVAGLGVDVDGELPLGFFGFAFGGEGPPVVGEPGVFVGEGDEVAGARVVEAGGGDLWAFEELGEAFEVLEGGAGGGEGVGLAVDVGDLVIGHGEGAGGFVIDDGFALGVELGFEEAGLAEGEVGEDGGGGVGHAVVAEDDEVVACVADGVGEWCEEGVEGLEVGDILGVGWAEALEVEIEVGDVDELEVRGVMVPDVLGGGDDPGGGGEGGHGGPVVVEGERAERGDEGGVEFGRVGEAGGESFCAGGVGGVDGFGGEDDVGGGMGAGG